jgi:hypothetical protein
LLRRNDCSRSRVLARNGWEAWLRRLYFALAYFTL